MATRRGQGGKESGRRRRRGPEPVDINLTVSFKFGETADDTLTMLKDRRVPMAGSLLDNRDRILRGFSRLLFKAAAMKPKLARELWPLLGRRGGRRGESN